MEVSYQFHIHTLHHEKGHSELINYEAWWAPEHLDVVK
jgi:hypothetical protein